MITAVQKIEHKFITDQYRNGLWTLEGYQSRIAAIGICPCICDECSSKGLHSHPCSGPHRQHFDDPTHCEICGERFYPNVEQGEFCSTDPNDDNHYIAHAECGLNEGYVLA